VRCLSEDGVATAQEVTRDYALRLEATGGADLTEREVRYLIEKEWARTAGDVLWRRTKLGLRFTVEQATELDKWIADELAGAPAQAAVRR
jgi:glycerol-3-phosphate dehydrogenase